MNSQYQSRIAHLCLFGGGNASIRPYQCNPHWRAAGVPTGTYEPGPHNMGYSTLDARVVKAVADAMSQIDRLLAAERFASLAFSWSHETKLGGRIFNTAQIVRDHIVAGLEAVVAKHNVALIRSQFASAGLQQQ